MLQQGYEGFMCINKEISIFLFVALCFGGLGVSEADSCTTFQMEQDGKIIIGKSYDWDIGAGLVVINKKGVTKQALPSIPGDTPLLWTSRYGSLSFNQYGVEFPNGGINEEGLVVEIMWLRKSQYPPQDKRPTLNEVQWIQYILDNYKSVDDVVRDAPGLRVSPVYASVHYLVCDVQGACAAFEYLDGKLKIGSGEDMIANTLTNSTYKDSVDYLETCDGFGGTRVISDGSGSLERFARASSMAKKGEGEPSVERAFEILDSVAQGDYTKWNIVYVPKELKIFYRTYQNRDIKEVSLSDFDTSCQSPARILEIDAGKEGDSKKLFRDFTVSDNRTLIDTSMESIKDSIPTFVLELLIDYPTRMVCEPEKIK